MAAQEAARKPDSQGIHTQQVRITRASFLATSDAATVDRNIRFNRLQQPENCVCIVAGQYRSGSQYGQDRHQKHDVVQNRPEIFRQLHHNQTVLSQAAEEEPCLNVELNVANLQQAGSTTC